MTSPQPLPRRAFLAAGSAIVAGGASKMAMAELCPVRDIQTMQPEEFQTLVETEFTVLHDDGKLAARLVEVHETPDWRPVVGRRRSFVLVFAPVHGQLPHDGVFHCHHPQIGTHELHFSKIGMQNEFQTCFT